MDVNHRLGGVRPAPLHLREATMSEKNANETSVREEPEPNEGALEEVAGGTWSPLMPPPTFPIPIET